MTPGNEEPAPDPSIEKLTFLARSRHRVQLLTQLSREEQTRRDLHDATGISQPTLGRILSDFEQRRWVSNHHNGAYTLTPLGALLADSVGDLLDVFGTITQLTDLTEQIPWERMDFDPHHLTNATITTPSSAEPLAHMRRFDELAAHATTVRVFSNVLSCAPTNESADTDREFLADIDELIVTNDALAGLDDPELRGWLRGRIEGGDISLYCREGPAVFLLGIFDDTVGIVPIDDAGMPSGLIEAESDPIRAWVEETFEEYRRTAARLTPEELSKPPESAADSV